MIRKEEKEEQITRYRRHHQDTGSPEVQIALFTAQINKMNEHFKVSPKDYGSKRGLLRSIGKRKALLKYLKSKDIKRYQTLIQSLSLRK